MKLADILAYFIVGIIFILFMLSLGSCRTTKKYDYNESYVGGDIMGKFDRKGY